MPLYDHFNGPHMDPRRWHSFHHAFASVIAFDLNARMPKGYVALPNIQFRIEIDVMVEQLDDAKDDPEPDDAVFPSWDPGPPTAALPLTITNEIVEVVVSHSWGDGGLGGAIEIVSPSNKASPGDRAAFAAKCATYLNEGAGLVVIDFVTSRRANMHNHIVQAACPHPVAVAPWGESIYVASYKPRGKNGSGLVMTWLYPLAIGQALPAVPLHLRDGPCMALELERLYADLLHNLRLDRVAG